MPTSHKNLLSLCQLPAGVTGRVHKLKGNADFCQRVREMGFGETTLVKKISGHGTVLCQIHTARIALNHHAAMNILVERLPAANRNDSRHLTGSDRH